MITNSEGLIAGNAGSHRDLRAPLDLWEPALPAIGPQAHQKTN